MSKTKFFIAFVLAVIASFNFTFPKGLDLTRPFVVIANYGPHPSLQETIDGIKARMKDLGYTEGKNIRYQIMDVNFDTSLIIQMITKLKADNPNVFVTISTPISQSAKNLINNRPIVFANVTDPESAGLVSQNETDNITGASDKQDLSIMINFVLKLIPNAKTIGVLYSSAEANDFAMVEMLKKAAAEFGLEVMAIPIEHARDTVVRIQAFKNTVDFIYTGSSGVVQSALPSIASHAEAMKIPHFNFNSQDVKDHNVLASIGVSHTQVGNNVADIIHKILKGEKAANIPVVYPSPSDYTAFISKKRADKIGLKIPAGLKNVVIVE